MKDLLKAIAMRDVETAPEEYQQIIRDSQKLIKDGVDYFDIVHEMLSILATIKK